MKAEKDHEQHSETNAANHIVNESFSENDEKAVNQESKVKGEASESEKSSSNEESSSSEEEEEEYEPVRSRSRRTSSRRTAHVVFNKNSSVLE